MGEARRKFDEDFKEGAVRLGGETGKPVAQVARELGVNSGSLGNWVNLDRGRRGRPSGVLGEGERAELVRLRRENVELAMRCDGVERSGARWGSTRWAAGSRGRVHRSPEGRSRHPAGGVLPGAGSLAVLVLQVGRGGSCRRGRLAGSASKPRWRACSGGMRASADPRGSPLTSTTSAGKVSENTAAALMRELGLAAPRNKRRTATTRPGERAGGWASASPWGARAPPWITRSSNPGTPRWSSSSGRCIRSRRGPTRGPRPPPGSRTTITTAGTRRWADRDRHAGLIPGMHLEQQADQFHGNVTIPAFSEICEQHVSSICLGAVDDAVAHLFHALRNRPTFHVPAPPPAHRL